MKEYTGSKSNCVSTIKDVLSDRKLMVDYLVEIGLDRQSLEGFSYNKIEWIYRKYLKGVE